MEISNIQGLQEAFSRKLSATSLDFKRNLLSEVNWDARFIGIKGARGTGKTTLLLQRIKESRENLDEVLYVSLDNLWFSNNKLEDLVDFLYKRGVRSFYLDEVHRYSGWSLVLKNLYDSYPDLRIVYTGSAMLATDGSKADLSRRQTLYTLHGMSFREYLEFEGIVSLPTIPLDEILRGHCSYSMDLCQKTSILKHFDDYLDHGCYPFYKESGKDFSQRLRETVALVIESDIPAIEDIQYSTVMKLRKLLMVAAENLPLEANINKLGEQLGSGRDQTLKMLYALDRAALLNLLTEKTKDYKHLVGPKKIYLHDTNQMHALSSRVTEGTSREVFFASQMRAVGKELTMPKKGDFRVEDRFTFEVGGPRKSFSQIADLPDSYLALDDIETGFGNRIPLWIFGMMY